jgi:DNA-binding MarR family transcriptional regulator
MTLNSARVVERLLRAHGLTVGMRAVLEVVTEGGPLTAPKIARALDVSRQATQRLVNELLASGHVTAARNPDHQRSQLILATANGAQAFAAIRAEEMKQLASLAPEVPTADLQRALEVLSAVARDIRHNANAQPEPDIERA